MSLLRSLLTDLVEKRLWPIALLLAIAVVAVPLVLGHGDQAASDAPVVLPAAPADAATAPTPAVKLVGPPSVRSRSGPVRDPFRGATKKKKAATATADGKGARSGSTPAAKSGAADAPATASVPATTQTTTTGGTAANEPAASDPSVYRTRVRWGQDAKAAVHGLSRLQPLGGLSNPALIYLGTSKGGARALFLLGPDAVDEGDGTCAEKTCRIIRLKPGDTTVVTVQGADGGVAGQYTLVVDDIVRHVATSANAAAKLRARRHPHGRDVLLEMITSNSENAAALGQFRYDLGLGAVVAKRAP